jgi:bile acid-coenzyme A ligase
MVVVGLPNCPEHLFATLGAWKLGGCVLPLRWDLPAWERERLIEVAEPRVIVADWDGAGLSRADIAASAAGRADPLPDCVPEPARAMASSGSTGRPKIIVAAGRGEDVPGVQQGPVERAPGRVRSELVPAPLYHTNGFVLAHRALFGGDRLVLMERFDAAQVVDLIERHQINVVTMVPTMLLRIARLPGVEKRDFSSLDAVWQGGASSCPTAPPRTSACR